MRPQSNLVIGALLTAVSLISAIPMSAQGRGPVNLGARLGGSQEVPVVMTTGRGAFKGQLSPDGMSLSYELSYSDLEGEVTQAHIHLGQPGVNGGVMAFLCTDLGNGPAGTPDCPDSPAGTVSGTVMALQIVGPANQGVMTEEFDEFVRALQQRSAYVNVHSDLFPTGEIRGQVSPGLGRGQGRGRGRGPR